MITKVHKCFKVSALREVERVETVMGDVVYVRNHPYVYMDTGRDEHDTFTKIYTNREHPKYNMDKPISLSVEPSVFKVDNTDSLEAVPAKIGDLIYRDGDVFMYRKLDDMGKVTYKKILKV